MARTMAPEHIPRHSSFLGLSITILILTICDLALLAYLQWAYDENGYNNLPANIVGGVIGFGLFVTIVTAIWVTYWLITTRKHFGGYHKMADMALVIAQLVFWLIEWAMAASVVASVNKTYRVAQYTYDGYFAGYVDETSSDLSKGLYGTVLALGLVIWFLLIAFLVLLFTHGSWRRNRAGTAGLAAPTYEQSYAKEGTVSPMTAHSTQPTTIHTAQPTYTTPATATHQPGQVHELQPSGV